MATQPIIVPDLGDFANVDVIEVLVKAGDSVKKEDSLITLETDKASMDVPAPADGVIATLTVKVGDKVSAGDTIGTLDSICQRWLIENALETGSVSKIPMMTDTKIPIKNGCKSTAHIINAPISVIAV